MNTISLIIAILILFVFIAGAVIAFKHRKPKLNPELYNKSVQQIRNTSKLDPAHAVMESHKIFIKALQSLVHKPMSAAQVTNYLLKYIPNQKDIWIYHRLRNRIAHETDITVSQQQADQARKVFVRGLEGLK